MKCLLNHVIRTTFCAKLRLLYSHNIEHFVKSLCFHDRFIRFGLSKRLVEDFVTPTLLVGLFKPPEELSALVVMELLYYYALAHQDSFDVRWIRKGTGTLLSKKIM